MQHIVIRNRRTDRVAHYSIQTIALEERRDQNTFKKNLERNGTYLKNITKQLSRRRSKHFLFVFNECGVCVWFVFVCISSQLYPILYTTIHKHIFSLFSNRPKIASLMRVLRFKSSSSLSRCRPIRKPAEFHKMTTTSRSAPHRILNSRATTTKKKKNQKNLQNIYF